jgi:outer membrane lipoprotein SlyB
MTTQRRLDALIDMTKPFLDSEKAMQHSIKWASIALVVTALGACASSSPDVIQRGDTQRMAQVQDGVVLSVRNVVVDGNQSGVGAAVGGVVGAIGGYGGSGVQREAQVLGVLAGVAGAAAGNALERLSTREGAVEILVQLKSGDRRAIVQAKGAEQLAAGDAVIIVTTGSKIRVTKAPK